MPDSHRMRRQPTRPIPQHSGRSLDPVVVRKGGGPGVGALFLVGGGLLAFSYAFNLGGLQVFLNSLLGGVDANTRSHSNQVVELVSRVLPYIGFAIGGVVVLVILTLLGRSAEFLVNPRKPKLRPVEKLKKSEAPRPAQEFIKPARLAIREQDLKKKSIATPNHPPAAG